MSATEELRRLLDERGVNHEDSELTDHYNGTTTYYTEWGGNDDGDGANVYVGYVDGTILRMFDATPEQAIAATLGSGTCSIEERNGDWYCTSCGEMVGTCDITSELHIDGNAVELWNHCPNCGRKVVNA